MRVAVLAGGDASGAAIREALERAGHEALAVDVEAGGRWSHAGRRLAVEPGGGLLGADVVLPADAGPRGAAGAVQGLLEIADVPYVGSGVLASALCGDRPAFRDRMARAGVPQVGHVVVREGDELTEDELRMPVHVKPVRTGTPGSASRVARVDELADAVTAAFESGPVAMIEAVPRGLEVACSVVGNADPEASAPGETGPGRTDPVVPARIDDPIRERVRELAVEAFVQAGCAGLARVDLFVEEGGRVLLNELDTMPALAETGVFARLLEASGAPYTELIDRLVRLAVERYELERSYAF